MAGQRIRQLRRMGVEVPCLGNGVGGSDSGDKPSPASTLDEALTRAREARIEQVRIDPEELPADCDLIREAKCALLEIVRHGCGVEGQARVNAAFKLAELARAEEGKESGAVDRYTRMSHDELVAETSEAEEMLQETRQ